MDYLSDQAHPFHGIGQKLKRADQNILNLDAEITAFFNSCRYPTIPNPDDEKWQEAVDYHRALPIPIRFSVLAGEIIHHLRSSLDHLAWVLSSTRFREEHGGTIAFPIVSRYPPPPKEIERLQRQIEGIADSRARDRIIALQPYHRGSDAIDDPLAIVHELDRTDKHRELVLIGSGVHVNFIMSPELSEAFRLHSQGKPLSPRQKAIIGTAIKENRRVTPTVLFPEFGKRHDQPVVPSLVQLINAIVQVIEPFEVLAKGKRREF